MGVGQGPKKVSSAASAKDATPQQYDYLLGMRQTSIGISFKRQTSHYIIRIFSNKTRIGLGFEHQGKSLCVPSCSRAADSLAASRTTNAKWILCYTKHLGLPNA
jgi:hypothetical protein